MSETEWVPVEWLVVDKCHQCGGKTHVVAGVYGFPAWVCRACNTSGAARYVKIRDRVYRFGDKRPEGKSDGI